MRRIVYPSGKITVTLYKTRSSLFEPLKFGVRYVIPAIDWRIDRNTVVRPDVLVFCKELPQKYLDYTPALVAEVLSPSTQHKDRTAKKELYQQQGVHWYLMIDPEKKSIEFLELDHDQFVERLTCDDQINLSLDGDCQIQLTLERIFQM